MTPKEKAEHLVVTMYNTMVDTIEFGKHIAARKCALIAVDEMIEMLKELDRVGFLKPNSAISIIEEVKQEIKNL